MAVLNKLLLLALWLQNLSTVELISVTPVCSNQSSTCIELSDALSNLTSGTTLELESGQHTVENVSMVHSMTNITLVGEGFENVTVICQDGFGITFINMTNLVISGLTITGCGLTASFLENAVDFLSNFIESNLTFIIPPSIKIGMFLGHCRNLNVSDTLITNTTGIGLLGINILGNSMFSHVNFTYNIRPFCSRDITYRYPSSPNLTVASPLIGGGAFFIFEDVSRDLATPENILYNHSLELSDCAFMYNAECSFAGYMAVNQIYSSKPYFIGGGGGLTILMPQFNYSVDVSIESSLFKRNDAKYGGGAYVGLFSSAKVKKINFSGCVFDHNGIPTSENECMNGTSVSTGGAGVVVLTGLFNAENILFSGVKHHIHFDNTVFTFNGASVQGGAVMGYSLSFGNYGTTLISFDRCHFQHNSARYGSALQLSQRGSHGIDGRLLACFDHVTIENGRVKHSHNAQIGSSSEFISALDLRSVLALVNNLTVRDNAGSGMYILSSLVGVVEGGSLRILNNKAYRGGGAYMDRYSPAIFMFPNSTLLFQNNTATAEGGGVYFRKSFDWLDMLEPHNSADCFVSSSGFRMEDSGSSMFNSNISIQFVDNKASLGSIVYGSTLESCSWAQSLNANVNETIYSQLYNNYNSTFYFSLEPRGTKAISTPAFYIEISEDDRNITTYPGQQYRIDVATLDVYREKIETVLTSDARSMNVYHDVTLGRRGYWYNVINYSIPLYVRGKNDTVTVTLYSPGSSESPEIEVSVLECPIGFVYDEGTHVCVCNISVEGVECDNSNISLTMNSVWLGCAFDECYTTDDLVVLECHFSYCNPRNVKFDYTDDDYSTQCAHRSHRAGIMCGQCKEGYSAVFGDESCQKCVTKSAWKILLMASIYGLVIFLCISLFHLTVDKGWSQMLFTFSTIIFPYSFYETTPFANYIKYALLPLRFLSIQEYTDFCFYDGLTPIAEVGYHFMFYSYLYFLMAIFTLMCRCSSFMSRHFSPAKTLMTLVYVSCIRLIAVCITILCPINVKNVGGTKQSVRWLIDPNVRYFMGWHSFLVSLSIVLICSFVALFILLLFPTRVYRCKHRCHPFLDVMWASFKLKYRFWLSIRLAFCACIVLLAKLLPPQYSIVYNQILLTIYLYVQCIIQPYKDKLINVCDGFLVAIVLLFHFGAYAKKTKFNVDSDLSPVETTYVVSLLASSYIVLIVTLLWYNRKGARRLLNFCRCGGRKRWRRGSDSDEQLDVQNNVTYSSVSINSETGWQKPIINKRNFSRLRESLLETLPG